MKRLLRFFASFREAMILRRHLSFLYEMRGSIHLYSGKNIDVFLHPESPSNCIMAHGQTIEDAIEAAKLKLAAWKIEQQARIAEVASLLVKPGAAGADA